VNNPDFNEVLIFYGLDAISFRDRQKVKGFLNRMRCQLQRIPCDNWPYSKPIMIAIDINGPTKMYSRRDVDNMSKVILDAGNKIIYHDDRLINILTVQKRLWKLPLYGFQIAIRVLDINMKDKYSPTMYFKVDTPTNDGMAPIMFHFENEADKEYVKQFKKNNLV
jgi:Holliday junction resolvase RusA-like endonuclease